MNFTYSNLESLEGKKLSGDSYMFQASEGLGENHYFDEVPILGRIEICPINSIGDFVIKSRAKNVSFRAAREITIKPGFTAEAGCETHFYIGACSDCPDEEVNPYYRR